MKRRNFMAIALTGIALAMTPVAASTADMTPYKDGLIKSELAQGKTLVLAYHATWCPVCGSQAAALEELRANNPKYDNKLSFIRVDWDDNQKLEVSWGRNVMARSTLLVLKGEKELGRLTAVTDPAAIKDLLHTAVEAANN